MIFKSQIEKEDYLIQEILDNFDFIKCWNVMLHLDWTWGFENRIPTVEELKTAATARLKHAISIAKEGRCSKSTYFSASGGLKGIAWVNRFGHIEAVNLEFILTEWQTDGDT